MSTAVSNADSNAEPNADGFTRTYGRTNEEPLTPCLSPDPSLREAEKPEESLREFIADMLLDALHEPACDAAGYLNCDCVIDRLRRAICQCGPAGATGEDIDECPSCASLSLAAFPHDPMAEAPF